MSPYRQSVCTRLHRQDLKLVKISGKNLAFLYGRFPKFSSPLRSIIFLCELRRSSLLLAEEQNGEPSKMTPRLSYHHYLFDVIPLLDECIQKLQTTIDRDVDSQHYALYDMKEVLCCAERLLHNYLKERIHIENQKLFRPIPFDEHSDSNLQHHLQTYREVLIEKQGQNERNIQKMQYLNPQDPPPTTITDHVTSPTCRHPYSNRSAATTDSLLFRLIVALQLCLVRIDDAHRVITGQRLQVLQEKDQPIIGNDHRDKKLSSWGTIMSVTSCCCCLFGIGLMGVVSTTKRQTMNRIRWNDILRSTTPQQDIMKSLTSSIGLIIAIRMANTQWKKLWMTDTIYKSTYEIDDWIKQWQTVQQTTTTLSPRSHREALEQETNSGVEEQCLVEDKSRRLIEYAMKNSPKSYFWQSQGEIRFLMVKRFMDVYYASIGTAIDASASSGNDPDSKYSWKVPLVAGAAASFYSITGTGASIKASHVVNKRSHDLIQHAWGMVSLPAIKTLMLHSSRLLKGASVADRLDIAGVPCFVLSGNPAPELAATLKRRGNRFGSIPQVLNRMSTIDENTSGHISEDFDVSQRSSFAGSCGRYRQRDVIFHLTGGGFFAHTIASDLPYLLDWSAATGAVVICPEYALLPENAFPVALNQIVTVYSALVGGVDLGFEVNRIIVTGESAGGNLAAALCVKLGMDRIDAANGNLTTPTGVRRLPAMMPDGIMLSCAALNLSLEMSHSRVVGTEDPVLPSGLISAISDAYLPERFSKKDPLASPFFACDAVLAQFPPALLFAGSNDPLLDDSVIFNERLRCCGVKSELRAAHNVPHAYWGLGTAGFPEARQVQQECQEWLKRQLSNGTFGKVET